MRPRPRQPFAGSKRREFDSGSPTRVADQAHGRPACLASHVEAAKPAVAVSLTAASLDVVPVPPRTRHRSNDTIEWTVVTNVDDCRETSRPKSRRLAQSGRFSQSAQFPHADQGVGPDSWAWCSRRCLLEVKRVRGTRRAARPTLGVASSEERPRPSNVRQVPIRGPDGSSLILTHGSVTSMTVFGTTAISHLRRFCEIPKPKGAIRPGMHLTFADRVIYLAAVGACLPKLHEALQWAQGSVDFSYLLAEDAEEESWMRGRFYGWKSFRDESLKLLDEGGYSYVVTADITAYYDLIDIGTLVSDLRAIGAPPESIRQISECLNRWAAAVGPSRGIPQGNSGSDLLAKLYLNSVDRALADGNFKHLRYVDDIRIFCHSRVEAQRAVMLLAKLLRSAWTTHCFRQARHAAGGRGAHEDRRNRSHPTRSPDKTRTATHRRTRIRRGRSLLGSERHRPTPRRQS